MTSPSARLLSLDFFRGATIAGMILVNNPGDWGQIYAPLKHAEWHGCTPTDLIFPFFLFIVGVSIALALGRAEERRVPRGETYRHIVRRTLILFGLGLALAVFPWNGWENFRIPGVLQRIAVCYAVVSLIFLNFSVRAQAIFAFAFIAVYTVFMELYPVPGVGAGSWARGENFSNWLDGLVLQGHAWAPTRPWDPEGVFSTLPAFSTTLFGVLTGHLIRSDRTAMDKVKRMALWGLAALVLALAWSPWQPINKSLWTGSYSLFTAGAALLCLSFSFWAIDVKQWRWGVQPFVCFGMNAIVVYVAAEGLSKVLYMTTAKPWLYNTLFASWLSPLNANLAYALAYVGLFYLLVRWMYAKKIFVKV